MGCGDGTGDGLTTGGVDTGIDVDAFGYSEDGGTGES